MDPFEYHHPTPRQTEILSKLRAKCKELNDLQMELLPPGRCRALAVTKLEEVSMWQNKACVFELPGEFPTQYQGESNVQ